MGKMKSQPSAFNAKAGMYTLNEEVGGKAKFAAMTRRLEELELKKIHEVQAVAKHQCKLSHVLFVNLMNTWWRSALQFQLLERCLENKQMSLDNSSPTTMLRMEILTTQVGGIIPNFSWKPRAPQYAQPAQPFQQASNLEQAIVNISKVVGDFVRDQKSINAQLSQRIDSVENTLNKRMDGMQNDLSQKIDNLQYSISRLTNLNIVQEKGRFPSQSHQNPKGIHEVETHEGESSQVRDVKALITLRSGKKVELPTPKPHVEEEEEEEKEKREEIKGKKKDINEGKEDHDSIMNANLEKDLCTIKRGLNVNKKAFLTEQVSAIIQCKSPLKYKDPGCPTISVMIGGKVVEKALLDLGASVNLLPYSVYKQLGLVDFVVLDTDPMVKETNYVPIILGRPFLATSNLITPEEEEGPEEVCIIDTLVEEHCWRRREEILPLINKEEAQEAAKEETPKLNLKPLPTELKYTYLEENKQCPVVISSSLTTPQEKCLLEVLKRCKKAIG
ncbi:hypothetical protein CK203_054427 [Vitis vinifera]|uniref:Uncharacterized protein n=1 Tax=Vitis vinifera TaxID=29760 RepID=A0A438GZW2_VITVI|nr:hypothetical protein CK203_054427 [Vitis vinifera]